MTTIRLIATTTLLLPLGQLFASDLDKALSKELASEGYAMFTPFRTDEEPGTIVLFTKDRSKLGKEFIFSHWKSTFALLKSDEFLQTNQVSFPNLTNHMSLGGSVSLKILEPVMTIGADVARTNDLQISFGPLLEHHYVTITSLYNKRAKLTQPVREALSFFAKKKQLDSCYLVLETLTAPSVTLKIGKDIQAGGNFSADKISQYLGLDIKAHYKKISESELSISTPIIVGYKAWRVADSFVDYNVGAPNLAKEATLKPEEIQMLKE